MTPLEALTLLLEAAQRANMPALNHQHCIKAYEVVKAVLESNSLDKHSGEGSPKGDPEPAVSAKPVSSTRPTRDPTSIRPSRDPQ